ncbi:MAG: hypothetical protein II915_00410 [Eubacterium sp.]|nr:hypothetical protein [Eubacterium sp.]
MKKKLLSIAMTLALILTACGAEESVVSTPAPTTDVDETSNEVAETEAPEVQAQNDKNDESWAIYWYLCGSDLETEYGLASVDIAEVCGVDLPDNVKIVLQTGGAKEWQNEVVKADKIGRYEVVDGDIKKLDEMNQANMGDGETLKDFLSFCNENYPADHKMVVFWDHGGGTTTGVAQDENYKGDTLSLVELRTAFSETCEVSKENPPYDIIGFDTCLMATVDVASIFKDVGRYLIGSEENETALGWTYDEWVRALAKNTAIEPTELGKIICDSYYKACEEYEVADSITMSVTDLSKIDPVLEAYNTLGNEALINMVYDDSFVGEFSRATKKTENYGGNTGKSGYSDMADMADLAENTKDILPESYQAVLDTIKDAVVYQIKGKFRSHANGLSCFIHYSHDAQMLSNYIANSSTMAFDLFYTYLLTGELDDDGYTYISNLLGGDEVETQEPFDISTLEDAKLRIENGNTAVLKIGDDARHLASVCYELYTTFDKGKTFVCLGSAATPDDVIADWDKGIFKDNFRGVWGSIDNTFVYMELVNTNDDYTMYQVPVKLNGEEMYLSVACDQATHEFTILGAQGETENGLSAKDLRKLEVGDEIVPILYAITRKKGTSFDMDPIIVSEDTAFEEIELGDGEYAIDFQMTGTDGKTAMSEIELFRVKDGYMKYL